ncbi:unnamed protein product [Amoebophrya sp. A25]|nr:unnamed protein product [Amoebophrya sp. A25]|eukprot:GSA25T00007424001.1
MMRFSLCVMAMEEAMAMKLLQKQKMAPAAGVGAGDGAAGAGAGSPAAGDAAPAPADASTPKPDASKKDLAANLFFAFDMDDVVVDASPAVEDHDEISPIGGGLSPIGKVEGIAHVVDGADDFLAGLGAPVDHLVAPFDAADDAVLALGAAFDAAAESDDDEGEDDDDDDEDDARIPFGDGKLYPDELTEPHLELSRAVQAWYKDRWNKQIPSIVDMCEAIKPGNRAYVHFMNQHGPLGLWNVATGQLNHLSASMLGDKPYRAQNVGDLKSQKVVMGHRFVSPLLNLSPLPEGYTLLTESRRLATYAGDAVYRKAKYNIVDMLFLKAGEGGKFCHYHLGGKGDLWTVENSLGYANHIRYTESPLQPVMNQDGSRTGKYKYAPGKELKSVYYPVELMNQMVRVMEPLLKLARRVILDPTWYAERAAGLDAEQKVDLDSKVNAFKKAWEPLVRARPQTRKIWRKRGMTNLPLRSRASGAKVKAKAANAGGMPAADGGMPAEVPPLPLPAAAAAGGGGAGGIFSTPKKGNKKKISVPFPLGAGGGAADSPHGDHPELPALPGFSTPKGKLGGAFPGGGHPELPALPGFSTPKGKPVGAFPGGGLSSFLTVAADIGSPDVAAPAGDSFVLPSTIDLGDAMGAFIASTGAGFSSFPLAKSMFGGGDDGACGDDGAFKEWISSTNGQIMEKAPSSVLPSLTELPPALPVPKGKPAAGLDIAEAPLASIAALGVPASPLPDGVAESFFEMVAEPPATPPVIAEPPATPQVVAEPPATPPAKQPVLDFETPPAKQPVVTSPVAPHVAAAGALADPETPPAKKAILASPKAMGFALAPPPAPLLVADRRRHVDFPIEDSPEDDDDDEERIHMDGDMDEDSYPGQWDNTQMKQLVSLSPSDRMSMPAYHAELIRLLFHMWDAQARQTRVTVDMVDYERSLFGEDKRDEADKKIFESAEYFGAPDLSAYTNPQGGDREALGAQDGGDALRQISENLDGQGGLEDTWDALFPTREAHRYLPKVLVIRDEIYENFREKYNHDHRDIQPPPPQGHLPFDLSGWRQAWDLLQKVGAAKLCYDEEDCQTQVRGLRLGDSMSIQVEAEVVISCPPENSIAAFYEATNLDTTMIDPTIEAVFDDATPALPQLGREPLARPFAVWGKGLSRAQYIDRVREMLQLTDAEIEMAKGGDSPTPMATIPRVRRPGALPIGVEVQKRDFRGNFFPVFFSREHLVFSKRMRRVVGFQVPSGDANDQPFVIPKEQSAAVENCHDASKFLPEAMTNGQIGPGYFESPLMMNRLGKNRLEDPRQIKSDPRHPHGYEDPLFGEKKGDEQQQAAPAGSFAPAPPLPGGFLETTSGFDERLESSLPGKDTSFFQAEMGVGSTPAREGDGGAAKYVEVHNDGKKGFYGYRVPSALSLSSADMNKAAKEVVESLFPNAAKKTAYKIKGGAKKTREATMTLIEAMEEEYQGFVHGKMTAVWTKKYAADVGSAGQAEAETKAGKAPTSPVVPVASFRSVSSTSIASTSAKATAKEVIRHMWLLARAYAVWKKYYQHYGVTQEQGTTGATPLINQFNLWLADMEQRVADFQEKERSKAVFADLLVKTLAGTRSGAKVEG